MSSYRHSFFVSLILGLLIVSGFSTVPAVATAHFLNLTYNGGGTCDTNGFFALGTLSVSAGGIVDEVDQVNGVVVFQGSPLFLNGSVLFSDAGLDRFFRNLQLPYAITETFTAAFPDGQTVTVVVHGTCSASGLALSLPLTGQAGGSAAFFAPGDGRVDPRPGDRLVIWCNAKASPPNVVVYGVADDQPDSHKGFYLATFNNADLLKAGPNGITQNAAPGDGTVSMMQDGSGHFYAAWNGGRYHATGQGIFSKPFACAF